MVRPMSYKPPASQQEYVKWSLCASAALPISDALSGFGKITEHMFLQAFGMGFPAANARQHHYLGTISRRHVMPFPSYYR